MKKFESLSNGVFNTLENTQMNAVVGGATNGNCSETRTDTCGEGPSGCADQRLKFESGREVLIDYTYEC